jgi:hypothetical protein
MEELNVVLEGIEPANGRVAQYFRFMFICVLFLQRTRAC